MSSTHTQSTLPAVLLVLLGLLAATGAARAGEIAADGPGALSAAQGDALLRQGRLTDAAKSYAKAAKAEPGNTAYRDRAVTIKRMAGLKRFVAKAKPSERWNRAVYSLHLFYLQENLPAFAVELDRKAFEQLKDEKSAAWLAEAYLANGQDAEATKLLAPYSGSSPIHAVYHAIALARLGSLEAAKKVAESSAVVNVELAPRDEIDYARMWTLLGRPESALKLLEHAFERTPGAALPTLKTRVRNERDFASLAALPAFAEVLKTESKVPSTCSGGSSCDGCPNRGKCGGCGK